MSLPVDSELLNDNAVKGLKEALDDIRYCRHYSEIEIMTEFGIE
jgi:hypothetical protein